MSANDHTPDDHALIRTGTLPRLVINGAPQRGQPGNTYACSCGAPIAALSRRQAKPAHLAHRHPHADKGKGKD